MHSFLKIDKENFELLFRELYTELCKYCVQLVRIEEHAEEIVQEQFIYLWEKRNKIQIKKSYKSYLYTAVKNKAFDYLKSKYVKTNFIEINDKDFHIQDDPQQYIEEHELNEMINKALKLLPEKCHTVFALSRFSSLSNKEIAEKLEISLKTVEAQITKALKIIKTYLDNNWDII